MPTTKTINITRIKFPEIQLKTRDAHKLRGYFGNLFKEHSPLLHNHYENGKFRYKYPLVQYKVVNKIPMLIGIEEGAELLPQLFLDIKEINIDNKSYKIDSKNIESQHIATGFSHSLKEYQFETLWMALNQKNYTKYHKLNDKKEKQDMINSILIGHVLNFFRNIELELQPSERLMAKTSVRDKTTQFKNQKMIAFNGSFIINAQLPNLIGLGKSVARGFGTIKKKI